jgi:hypothetical protein
MTSDFIATVVAQCRLVVGSGKLIKILQSALCYRDSLSHVKRYLVHQVAQTRAHTQGAGQGQGQEGEEGQAQTHEEEQEREAKKATLREFESRAEDDSDEMYVLKGSFSLAKCLTLPPGKFIRR